MADSPQVARYPILLFLALALAAGGSVELSAWSSVASLACIAVAVRFAPGAPRSREITWLSVAVLGLASWIFLENYFLNVSYTPVATYQAGFLVAGFLLGRSYNEETVKTLFTAGLAFGCALAAWVLWQVLVEGGTRPRALFHTPATLTTVINLILVPGLVVLISTNVRPRIFLGALALLVAAVFLANSRGGWLTLSATCFLVLLLLRRSGLRPQREAYLRVGAVLLAGWALAEWASLLARLLGTPGTSIPVAETGLSLLARLDMYQLAMRSLAPATLPAGTGFFTFFYWMQERPQPVFGYESGITYFVHDDYLQMLLELGLPGFLGLCAISAAPLLLVWRTASRAGIDSRLRSMLIALFAALASMAIHAFVDFPFYVPVCILIYSTALGVLENVLRRCGLISAIYRLPAELGPIHRAGIAAAATLLGYAALTPVAAEAAARLAYYEWKRPDEQRAAYWFELARRIDSADWRYHWQAGLFWSLQVMDGGGEGAARLADRAYAAGMAANPLDANSVVGRVALHRRFGKMLPPPAAPDELRRWAQRAVDLAPRDAAVRAEQQRVLKELAASDRPAAK